MVTRCVSEAEVGYCFALANASGYNKKNQTRMNEWQSIVDALGFQTNKGTTLKPTSKPIGGFFSRPLPI